MGGIARICKSLGSIKINGKLWLWDYVADEPVLADDMPIRSERWYASEKARAEYWKDKIAAATAARPEGQPKCTSARLARE